MFTEEQQDELFKLYTDVFNTDGSVKVCGREKCKTLIKYLSNLVPGIGFGNRETGFMCISNVQKYTKKILNDRI